MKRSNIQYKTDSLIRFYLDYCQLEIYGENNKGIHIFGPILEYLKDKLHITENEYNRVYSIYMNFSNDQNNTNKQILCIEIIYKILKVNNLI